MKVKIAVNLLLGRRGIFNGKFATATYFVNTNNIVVQAAAAVIDDVVAMMWTLECHYLKYLNDEEHELHTSFQKRLRKPAWCDWDKIPKREEWCEVEDQIEIPEDEDFKALVRRLHETMDRELMPWPRMRQMFGGYLQQRMGLTLQGPQPTVAFDAQMSATETVSETGSNSNSSSSTKTPAPPKMAEEYVQAVRAILARQAPAHEGVFNLMLSLGRHAFAK